MNIIEFPGLGLSFYIDRVAFKIFGLPIYWYGIIIASSFLLAVILSLKNCKKNDIDQETILDLVLFAVPAAVIAARLYYVIFSWNDFKGNLLDVFNTRKGGLAIYGAVIGAVIVAFIYARVKKVNMLKLIDFCSPYLILAQGIGRWGNFVNQEAFGVNTSLPWGMTGTGISQELANSAARLAEYGISVDPALPVHPTFLYESLWNFAIFAFLLWYGKRKKLDGEVFILYVILYGIGRAWVESLRIDSLMLGSFRISQLIAIATAALFIVIFILRRVRSGNGKADDHEGVEIGMSEYGSILKKIQNTEETGNNADNEGV